MPKDLPESASEDNQTNANLDLTPSGWQARYEQGKTGWDRGRPNSILDYWLASKKLLPGRVLIPGCGRGHEVIRLAEEGFDVTALDFAPAAIRHLNQVLARRGLIANVIQADVLEYESEKSFDVIYEQTCLCALSPAHWLRYESKLHQWLKPNGQLLALFMQSGKRNEPPYSCELVEMQQLFPSSRWHWTGEPVRVDHPTGLHEVACCLSKKDI
jgi:methyl halide transferase